MNRKWIAAAWIAGAVIPVTAAALFIAGCCVLPFHGLLHKLMPLCDMAASVMIGEPVADDRKRDAVPPAPAREKQEPAKRLASTIPHAFRIACALPSPRLVPPSARSAYRSFITLGAIRCDQDIGLHVLGSTFLI